MSKSKDAFRTISEVAEWLDTPTHVLRFWESKFSQIKPVKGAGRRRYYRPKDMDFLGGLKKLLHEDGMTIKGAQKLIREKGVKHVAALGLSMSDAAPVAAKVEAPAPQTPPAPAKVASPAPTPKPSAPPAAKKPVQEEPVQAFLPFDLPEMAPPAPFKLTAPRPPKRAPKMKGRLLGHAPRDAQALAAKAGRIEGLLDQMEDLQKRLRA